MLDESCNSVDCVRGFKLSMIYSGELLALEEETEVANGL